MDVVIYIFTNHEQTIVDKHAHEQVKVVTSKGHMRRGIRDAIQEGIGGIE